MDSSPVFTRSWNIVLQKVFKPLEKPSAMSVEPEMRIQIKKLQPKPISQMEIRLTERRSQTSKDILKSYTVRIDMSINTLQIRFSVNVTSLTKIHLKSKMSKKIVNLDLPLQIGCFVYQYTKLRMLEFYYDFMDVFVDHRDFQYFPWIRILHTWLCPQILWTPSSNQI